MEKPKGYTWGSIDRNEVKVAIFYGLLLRQNVKLGKRTALKVKISRSVTLQHCFTKE